MTNLTLKVFLSPPDTTIVVEIPGPDVSRSDVLPALSISTGDRSTHFWTVRVELMHVDGRVVFTSE